MEQTQIARSLLFVPGDRPERFEKAHASGAHGVIIDLEDAVLPANKLTARAACRAWLDGGGSALVRVNALDTEWASDDLAICGLPGVRAVVLPKTESAQGIEQALSRAGGKAAMLPLVETAAGMLNLREIAFAPGVSRLLFGTVDFCLDLGIEGDGEELAAYRAQLVLVSRAAGLLAPVDGITLALKDEHALRESTLSGKRIGFGGKMCIHPSQVALVNACYQPTESQLEWARKIVELAGRNAGAFEFEGKMVDAPVVARARRILG
ncbi:MAG: CoA ester lyase [Burkholderiales bacterium]